MAATGSGCMNWRSSGYPALARTACRSRGGGDLSLLPCAAQEGGTVTLQFLSFPKSIDPKPVELFLGDGKTIEVEIPTNAFSKLYKISRLRMHSIRDPLK